MAKIITGTHGRINELIANIPNDEIISLISSADGKLSVLVSTNGVIGTPLPSDEKERFEAHCQELESALADCKERCEKEAKNKDAQLDSYIKQVNEYVKENAKLNKDLEKKETAIEKLKQDLEKVKSALKALE